MGAWEWGLGMETGDWGLGTGESRLGNRDWGMGIGSREPTAESRQPIADSG